jgi:LPS-assembly protein
MAYFLRLLSLSILFSFVAINSPLSKEKKDAAPSQIDTKTPALIEADSLHYDQKASIATAAGNVQVTQGEMILLADKVTYNQKTNLVEAEGNISLRNPDGTVFFADSMKLKDDMKQGVINNFSARFIDNSKMASTKAERVNEDVAYLENATYSPCIVCEGSKYPLWQVSAKKATIDQKNQTVTYKNAYFEVKGVPVLYTPYLSHPTPDADRKSGFLVPKYSTDNVFGTVIKTPYYYNIAPDKDMVITPIFTAEEGAILSADYRQLVESGSFTLGGSITNPRERDENGNVTEGHDIRGHIEGKGDFKINDIWDWGFSGKRSTDDTYLRRYHFGDEDVLTSKIFTTAIEDRNNLKVEAITFQGLQADDDPGKTPLVLPSINGHYESTPGFYGSRWMVDANALSLTRDEGISSNRLSLKGGWKLPYITKFGHVLEFNTSLRGDMYGVDNVPENPMNPNGPTLDGFEGRAIPQAELKWSLPLVNEIRNRQVFLEPIANFVVSPYGGNPDKIPNEDSQDVEFSDENLFDSNHFSGLDRVEGGPRVNYGLRGKVYDPNYGDVGFLFGQNYHAKETNEFKNRSGLDDQFSDYVGRISYDNKDFFNFAYRFRLDKENFALNRNDILLAFDIKPIKFDLDYVSLSDTIIDANGQTIPDDRKSVIANATIDLTDTWKLSAAGNRNIEDSEWVSTKASLVYTDNCISIGFSWFKEFTRDRDIEPNTTYSIEISLKNLGY